MGFSIEYCSELIFHKFLLQVAFFIDYVHGFISSAFGAIGLSDLLNPISWPVVDDTHRHNQHYYKPLVPYFGSVVNYNKDGKEGRGDEICVVCLQELVDGDAVRNLINCQHVFHKCCLDPWVELGRRNCPLCRSSLVQEEVDDDFGGGDDGSYYESFEHLTWTSSSSSSSIDASIEYFASIFQ